MKTERAVENPRKSEAADVNVNHEFENEAKVKMRKRNVKENS